ncbi:PspC domain-containing protein [Hymenobacter sp. BT175]|uniref:GIN domain-containing protein n=1 Tax=Hymenobacter translucens TaxID=2886507 RepID=UPI001D0DFA98|nr:PspC domain-containing protein [Hymenobacter translucens]MCC2546652.1 PspC domain-containing protein [Hymenobacter translucens]
MKKNISINLQGLIFHIEEDGYDVLSRYLAEVKAHFSGYRGHEEIVADIEGRIAELFAARTSATKQVISLADVQEMVAKMGRVSDFQSADEAEDDEQTLEGAVAAGTAAGSYTSTGAAAPEAEAGPRRLFRDMANRKVAGVSAGLARYFGIEPLWIRVLFLGLVILPQIIFDNTVLEDFAERITAITFIIYIVLWIALPKRYDTVAESQTDPSFKKLFRDTDNGKVGGVSAGLAAYLKTDVTLIRILFLAGLFAGGFTVLAYILLWILVPEAKTVSDRMRMRGDAVTLSGIDNNLRNNAYDTETTGNRPVGTFLEELFRNLRPLVNFAGSVIRWFAGIMLTIIGFGILVSLTLALAVGLNLIPETNHIVLGDVPAHVLLNDMPKWGVLAGYLASAIPAASLLLIGLGLLFRRSLVNRTVSASMLGLWLLGVVGTITAVAQVSQRFQEEGMNVQTQAFNGLTAPVLFLDRKSVDRGSDEWVDVTLVAADSSRGLSVTRTVTAKGATEADATATAASSISYNIRQSNDSTLVFDNHFAFRPGARYRDQSLELTVRLPRDKSFRLSEDFADWIGSEDYVNNRIPDNVEKHLFRLQGNQLACLDCSADDLRDDTSDDSDEDDYNVNIDVDEDGDSDGNINLHIDMGKADFSTNPNEYGSGRRTYSVRSFSRVEASGAYRVVVSQGSDFKVTAAGEEESLRHLRVKTDGDQLEIYPEKKGFLSMSPSDDEPVLISVQMPTLRALDLSGACKGNVSGFNGDALKVSESGACVASLSVNVPTLQVELSGASRADLRGRTANLQVDGSGAVKVNALGMQAQRANVELSGFSQARVRVNEHLQADLSGSSQVDYAGNPSSIRRELSGSSRVRQINNKE